ncbi:ABC transporter substrate-binding protein [Clostridium sp. NSJ-6]|uniref:ABC transporter substrate-binding protein n=1 Tax=Clostridium hominis TaxID=2763036 RepID=A0ABR7D9W4_9CLOT|nr:ABC transporter substrate-binding protein [Clostridium hominis]MBC5628138.1 ABC transporter substrate-binding protein [Clostridium hominis]
MKKRLLAAIMASTMLFVGCSNGNLKTEQGGNTDGVTEVLLWHSMSGNVQEKLNEIVDGFNSSQSKIKVVAENQGTYDESTSKFFNMNGGSGSPAIIQIGEQNLQSMIDSNLIEPMSNLIKDYNYNIDKLVPQVVNFYSVNDTLYTMPFNASSPVLYYNAEALKKAGIEEVPQTFEAILAAGEKISSANNGMKAFAMHAYGYALDQMVTNLGGFIINNENGRIDRATEVAYQDQVTDIFTWISDLIKADQFINYGSNSQDVVTGFNNGDISMFITTSASAAKIVSEAPFEVGVAYLPYSEGVEPQGVYAGGGALCVTNGLSEEVREAAMEFITYATSAEVQATWAGGTGYFPINVKAYETETMKNIYAEKPQLKVAADQFLTSKETAATAGPLLSQLPQLRNDLQAAIEEVFNGGDVAKAIDGAVANTNKAIETANKSIKN